MPEKNNCLKYFLAILFSLLIAACGGKDHSLPTAEPLTSSAAEQAQLYKITKGPYQVAKKTDLIIAATHRELELNLYYPEDYSDNTFPLLLFSHGNWSDKDAYDRIIEHWTSHGYITISINHLDCCSMLGGIISSIRHGQLGLIEGRINDLVFLLDNLDSLAVLVPAIAGKIDRDNIAATGHSFGAFSAQQLAGAGTFDPDDENYLYFRDQRIKAVVAISPPGEMFDTITDGSWLEIEKPMLVTTGTWDSNEQFWPDWRAHKLSFDTAKPGQNYALVTQGADHYLGNLICTLDREITPQYDALNMLNVTTTAFLDAYLKNNSQAAEFISGDELAVLTKGFAVIEHR